MKKLFLILCSISISTLVYSQDKCIPLCPILLLDTTNDSNALYMPADLPDVLATITINDALVALARIVEGVTILSTQPHNAARVGAQVAAVITSLMAKTTKTAVRHHLIGTDSLAQLYPYLLADTKRPRPNTHDAKDRERIRDVLLATFVNILSNVAVITAHPHDHKLVASQATLMAANILNAVKETVRSPLAHEDYEYGIQQLTSSVTRTLSR
ncbi:MAG: hypothetical protein ACHQVS_00380 [Candidatus Babeliales bacterium]